MALQFATGTVPANLITGFNLLHAAQWGAGGSSHYDLAETSTAGVEQVVTAFYGSTITDLPTACNAVNKCKALLNDHYTRGNAGSGSKIFSHKVADEANVVGTADMSDGSVYDAALLASITALVVELRLDYAAHISNGGGVWHTTADALDVLGGVPTILSWDDLAEALNNLKAQYTAHIARGATIHAAADSTNTISAPNASATSPDSCLVLANQLKLKLNAHRTEAGVHALDDSVNIVSGADAAYPANLFTLVNAVKSSYGTHRTSTTYHDTADATNVIAAANATTVATLIALAEELRTDLTAHFRNGPASAAVRSL